MHHGVKGMKWGVRHDQPSVGRRYSNWGKKTSNKMYDKMSSNVEARRQRNKQENWAKNSKNKTVARYGNWVDRTSDKVYDKKIQKIEDRRQRKMQEFEEFDKALDAKDKVAKKFKLSSEQKKMAKRIAIGAAVVAGVGLATYGGVKLTSIRSYNKASIAKFLDANPDIANSVLKGGKPYKSPVERIPKYLSGVASKGSTISKGKIHNSIKGPTLQTTRSTVTAYAPPNYAGINPPYVSKMLERDAIGAKGRGRIMTKEQKKYYSRMYKDYIRSYKQR